jgi:hypothetical protein
MKTKPMNIAILIGATALCLAGCATEAEIETQRQDRAQALGERIKQACIAGGITEEPYLMKCRMMRIEVIQRCMDRRGGEKACIDAGTASRSTPPDVYRVIE